MDTEIESQLGQLAIARGMVNLRTLLICMETAGRDGRRLTDVLISEGHLTNLQYEELYDRLQDTESVRKELELGSTIVLEEVARSASAPAKMDTFPETMELELDPHLDLEVDGESRYEFMDELGRGGMVSSHLQRTGCFTVKWPSSSSCLTIRTRTSVAD